MAQAALRIAILTHNALASTERCLASLFANTKVGCEVVILDNGSADGSASWLGRLGAPNLRVMLSPVNVGVPKGRNLLLAAILQSAGRDDLIVFLDNDVEVGPCWHDPFLDLFAQRACAAIAGVTGHEIIVSDNRRELLPSPEQGPAEVDVVSGYCLWVRAGVAARLGPLDENLGLFWHEDDDYCVRAIGLGHRVFCLPGAAVLHHGHQSGVDQGMAEPAESVRNQEYLIRKWRALGLVGAGGRIIRQDARQDAEPGSSGR